MRYELIKEGPIVVGTDFSPGSRAVVEYATALALAESKPLYLAYAMPVVPDDSPALLSIQQEELSNQIKIAEKKLEGTGLAVQGIFTMGGATQELLQAADKLAAGYLVVGTMGSSGVDRLLVGSVAEAVARKSDHPVIVVGPEAARHPAQTVPWKHILLACDPSHGVTDAARLAGNLALSHHARLSIFNVRESGIESPTEEQFNAMEEMMSREAWLTVMPQCLIRLGEPAKEIIRMVKDSEADLLVMSAQSGGALLTHLQAGIIATILRTSRCPVMILRDAHRGHPSQESHATSSPGAAV
jgi:nucleotide-binding universal stress UspA family protein